MALLRQTSMALAVAAFAMAAQSAQANPPKFYLVVVDSTVDPAVAGGVASGVTFKKGQAVAVSATGTMTLHATSAPFGRLADGTNFGYYGPGGIPGTVGSGTTADCNAGALVGRIGTGPAHCINSAATWQAEATGQLYLFVNDVPGYSIDNLGVFDVLVKAP